MIGFRRVSLEDRLWSVPEYCDSYQAFSFPGWESPLLFGNSNPIAIEYCSGNGSWIAAQAEKEPHWNWLAVEKRLVRIRKICAKIHKRKLANLVALHGEAYLSTRLYIPAQSVQRVFINFPDPWPKKRHAKNRLIQPLFIEELRRILKPGATVQFVTDDAAYSSAVIGQMLACGFSSAYPAPYFVSDLPDYGVSYFENLWREKGREIRYHLFQLMD